MKKYIKLLICSLLVSQLITSTVMAQTISLKSLSFYDVTYKCFIGDDILDILPNVTKFNQDGEQLEGKIEYLNTDNRSIGYNEVEWMFTPNDININKIHGIVKVNVLAYPILTEHYLKMYKGETYDINVDNKVSNCKYKWTSSDTSVATVVTKNGKVTALKGGITEITCTITTPSGKVIVLKCKVNVN